LLELLTDATARKKTLRTGLAARLPLGTASSGPERQTLVF
jgi:hypothetical protein